MSWGDSYKKKKDEIDERVQNLKENVKRMGEETPVSAKEVMEGKYPVEEADTVCPDCGGEIPHDGTGCIERGFSSSEETKEMLRRLEEGKVNRGDFSIETMIKEKKITLVNDATEEIIAEAKKLSEENGIDIVDATVIAVETVERLKESSQAGKDLREKILNPVHISTKGHSFEEALDESPGKEGQEESTVIFNIETDDTGGKFPDSEVEKAQVSSMLNMAEEKMRDELEKPLQNIGLDPLTAKQYADYVDTDSAHLSGKKLGPATFDDLEFFRHPGWDALSEEEKKVVKEKSKGLYKEVAVRNLDEEEDVPENPFKELAFAHPPEYNEALLTQAIKFIGLRFSQNVPKMDFVEESRMMFQVPGHDDVTFVVDVEPDEDYDKALKKILDAIMGLL